MKFSAIFFLLCSIFFSCTKSQSSNTSKNSSVKSSASFTAMNTFMTIQVFSSSEKNGKEACNAVQKKISELENILSTTILKSDTYKINHSEGDAVFIHSAVFDLIDFSLDMYKKTERLFNPALYPLIHEWGFTTDEYKIPEPQKINELLAFTDFDAVQIQQNDDENLPYKVSVQKGMQLDFGAIAKGYAGDKIIELLCNFGIESALINLGGNVQALGKKPDGSLWKIGIKNPWSENPACSLKIENCAVITSGGYERFFTAEDGKTYIHIFDSRTGCPAESDLESVTIICPQGTYADALSTSLFVMGKDGAVDFWRKTKDFDFVLITKNRKLIYSSGIEKILGILYDFDSVIKIDG